MKVTYKKTHKVVANIKPKHYSDSTLAKRILTRRQQAPQKAL